MKKYVGYLKAIGEETRLRILRLLLEAKKPLCVCEIMECTRVNQTNISKHLKILKYSGLIKEKREGKFVLYYTIKSKNKFINSLFNTINSIPEELFKKDMECLKKISSLRKKRKINGKRIYL